MASGHSPPPDSSTPAPQSASLVGYSRRSTSYSLTPTLAAAASLLLLASRPPRPRPASAPRWRPPAVLARRRHPTTEVGPLGVAASIRRRCGSGIVVVGKAGFSSPVGRILGLVAHD
ncbi:hypothetical protein SEVIR_9G126675v4 [Setaria viridis]